MFPKWKKLNSHWIKFTIQYGYMISTISLQYSWHPSHHSSTLKKYPIRFTIELPHVHLWCYQISLYSDFANLITRTRSIYFFDLLVELSTKNRTFSSFNLHTMDLIYKMSLSFASSDHND
jgi:hypothetical protein